MKRSAIAGGPNTRRSTEWLAAAIITAGAVVRLRLYLARRSFWDDEAAVALNLVSRPFLDLLAPLDYRQTAPPLFLWIERVIVLIAGAGEWTLRAVPFLSGVAVLVLMWHVGRRLLPTGGVLVALALVALSPLLVYFSNELKPYSSDAMVTLLLALVALRVGERPDGRARWIVLALGGALAAAFSTTAAFVLAGVVAYLVVSGAVRRAPGVLVNAGLVAAVWAVAAVLLALVHRELLTEASATGSWMRAFWKDYFLSNAPPGLRMRVWIITFGALKDTLVGGSSRQFELAALVATAALGLIRLVRLNGAAVGCLIAVPYACLAVAGALHLYPLGPRLILFAAPLTALLLASGLTWAPDVIARRVSRPVGILATAAAALALLLWPIRNAAETLRNPPGRQELRRLIHQAARERQQAAQLEPVWLSSAAELPWRFYAGDSLRGVSDTMRIGLAGHTTEVGRNVIVGDWWHGGDRGVVEVGRVRERAAGACGWLLFALFNEDERSALLRGVAQLNGRVDKTTRATGAALDRVCFAGDTTTNGVPS